MEQLGGYLGEIAYHIPIHSNPWRLSRIQAVTETCRVGSDKRSIGHRRRHDNRGKESGEVIKSIKLLCEQYPNNVHAVIGNHEEMMGWHYERGDRLWLSHGGKETI